MELAEDFSLTLPLIFTVLAVILATLWVKLRSAAEKQPAEESHDRVVKERVAETLEDEQKCEENQAVVEEEPERTEEDQAPEEKVPKRTEEDQAPEEKVPKRTDIGTVPVEEVGIAEELTDAKESETDTAECVETERTPSSQSSQEEEEDSKEEDVETENDKVLKISEADDADDEDFSFKYLPGKLRGSDYEKMLTPDELDEEQRIELTSDFTSL